MSEVNFGFRIGFRSPNFDFGFAINQTEGLRARDRINDFFGGPGRNCWGNEPTMPRYGSVQQPQMGYSGAPAGQGLQKNADGSFTDAGGYRIHPEGGGTVKIYGPDGKELTKVWGDPHVEESDGTKWDFTKNSDFVLPSGTRIAMKTNYDPAAGNGQSVVTGLDIMNGTDRAHVENVNGTPTSTMHGDAYEFRAAHVASNPNRDTFFMGGTGADNVNWTRQRDGQLDGIVQNAHNNKVQAGDHQIYDQVIDRGALGRASGTLAPPPVGSRAWGNLARSEIDDRQAMAWGQAIGPLGAWPAMMNGYGIKADHQNGEMMADIRDMFFGGWRGNFPNYFAPFDAMSSMIDMLRSDRDWQRQVRAQVDVGVWT